MDEILTPEIRQMVGNESRPQTSVDVLDKSSIRRWVTATLDDNALWYDEELARDSRFGGDCGPGPIPMLAVGHWKRRLGTSDSLRSLGPDDDLRYGEETLTDPAVKIPWPEGVGAFHAGNEIEYFQLPRVGDVISVVIKIVDMEEKDGRSGRLAIVHTDRTYKNQHGDLLIINHMTNVARRMPGKGWGDGAVR